MRKILLLFFMAGAMMAKADGEVPVSNFPISIPLVYAPIHAGYESEPDYFGRHKMPPMVPVLLSVDEEKSALEVGVRQSCKSNV